MAKSIDILEVISILQFSQKHLIFEVNLSKEIKKMIAKQFNETSMCFNLMHFSAQRFKAFCDPIMLCAFICSHALTHYALLVLSPARDP